MSKWLAALIAVTAIAVVAGVTIAVTETRYQSCVTEAEASNPVHSVRAAGPTDDGGLIWEDEASNEVVGIDGRASAIDDCARWWE